MQGDTNTVKKALTQAGETRLIDLKIDDEKKARQVLVRNVQWEAITGELIHVDFYEVRKGEKIEVEIPILFIGDAPALKASAGSTVAHELNTLNMQVLPENIPNHIEVNLTSLEKPGDVIRVKDVKVPTGMAILNGPEVVVAVITVHVEEKAPVKEAPATATTAAATPAAEATKPAEGKAGKPAEGKAK